MKNREETLEEVAETAWQNYEYNEGSLYSTTFRDGFINGVNWQQEQFNNEPTEENKNLYTKEDLENAFVQGALTDLFNTWRISEKDMAKEKFVQWFEEFKK